MMNWYGTGMGGWGYLLMIVNTVLFWGLIPFIMGNTPLNLRRRLFRRLRQRQGGLIARNTVTALGRRIIRLWLPQLSMSNPSLISLTMQRTWLRRWRQ